MTPKRIRILHALGTLDPGGVETWLLNVMKYVDRDRFEFHFCTFGRHAGLYAAEIEKLGGKVLRCPKGANLWSFARRFRKILREGNYDVVHSHVHLFSGAALRWAKAEGVPMRIAHSHTSRDGRPDTPARRGYRRLMNSWIDRYATHGLAASRLAAEGLFGQNWGADSRFRVLYYGIDLGAFEEPVSRKDVRKELGIPLDVPVVGHVGRFVPPKNHRFLLDVASEILKRRPEVHFLLVGDGPLRPEIESRGRAMGLAEHVHFAGTRIDVSRLLRGAMDLFLFPSLYEGFGLSVVEAQAAGLNCLISNVVPEDAVFLPEVVTSLSLSAGADSWSTEMIRMLDKPRSEPSSLLQRMADSPFSVERSSKELAGVYLPIFASTEALAVEQHA